MYYFISYTIYNADSEFIISLSFSVILEGGILMGLFSPKFGILVGHLFSEIGILVGHLFSKIGILVGAIFICPGHVRTHFLTQTPPRAILLTLFISSVDGGSNENTI